METSLVSGEDTESLSFCFNACQSPYSALTRCICTTVSCHPTTRISVCSSEFQTGRAENRKARLEKSVLENGRTSSGMADERGAERSEEFAVTRVSSGGMLAGRFVARGPLCLTPSRLVPITLAPVRMTARGCRGESDVELTAVIDRCDNSVNYTDRTKRL